MKLLPTTDERDLRSVFGQILRDHCPPELVRSLKDPDATLPEQLWQVVADAGVFDLAASGEPVGELSAMEALGIFAEEAGRVNCPAVIRSSITAALVGQLHGMSGEVAPTAVALWDPIDAHRPLASVHAEQVDDGWRLRGTVTHVEALGPARELLVCADSDDGPVLCTLPVEGLHSEVLMAMDGPVWSVDLEGVVARGVASSSTLMRTAADRALALQACEVAGGCAEVLARSVAYVSTREQFGRPIGTFQAVQHLIADMHIRTEATRLAARQAVFHHGHGQPTAASTAIATMQACDAYPFVTLTAHQVHGGMGYVREADLHLWSERAKALQVRGGTADIAAGWLQEEMTRD